ncbi:hypothetical protein, partial [Marichromatium gracile]|uniref:hypothetical protein n=1 Tax=Marichromatium gracile TaxID=1048 RepID=UPI001A9304CF
MSERPSLGDSFDLLKKGILIAPISKGGLPIVLMLLFPSAVKCLPPMRVDFSSKVMFVKPHLCSSRA